MLNVNFIQCLCTEQSCKTEAISSHKIHELFISHYISLHKCVNCYNVSVF